MGKNNSTTNLGRIEQSNVPAKHVPSTTQADTLFNFTENLEYLVETLKSKMLSPRYNTENVEYLSIDLLKSITS